MTLPEAIFGSTVVAGFVVLVALGKSAALWLLVALLFLL
jgi:hypothetical protein